MNSAPPSIPGTMEEFQKVLIEGYHTAESNQDRVYNEQTAEHAIRSTTDAIIECLAALPDATMLTVVRHLAGTSPRKIKP